MCMNQVVIETYWLTPSSTDGIKEGKEVYVKLDQHYFNFKVLGSGYLPNIPWHLLIYFRNKQSAQNTWKPRNKA